MPGGLSEFRWVGSCGRCNELVEGLCWFHPFECLSRSSVELVGDPVEPVAAAYGLGVGVFHLPTLENLEHYGHGGNGFGYVAMLLYLPRSQACVVLLTNDGGGTMGAAAAPFLRAVDSGL